MPEQTKMRASEAAHYLRLAVSTLARMRCYGAGPRFAKIGNRLVVYDKADLDAWLADRLYNSTSEYKPLLESAINCTE